MLKALLSAVVALVLITSAAYAQSIGGSSGISNGSSGAGCNPPTLACVDVPSGLVFWMPFDTSTTSGSTSTDLANGHNGALETSSATIGAGQIQQSLVLDGSAAYTQIADASVLNFQLGNSGKPFSLSAWIYLSSDNGGQMNIFTQGYDGSITPWDFWVNTSTLTVSCGGYNGSFHDITSNSATPLSLFTHWVCTSDGAGNYKIYKNGSLDNSHTDTTAVGGNTQPIAIGAGLNVGSSTQFFPGFIDDVRAYNRVLTSTEVTRIYTDGFDGIPGGSPPSFGPGAIGYLATCSDANGYGACPPGIAFRNWAALATVGTVPMIPQDTGAYNAGGVSNAYARSWTAISGTFKAPANCTPSGATRNTAWQLCLYTSPDAVTWTDDSGVNPVIAPTGSGWNDQYMLHPAIAPHACSQGTYCLYVSAQNSSSNDSIGLYHSSDLVSWTAYGSNPVIATTTSCGGGEHNMLPSVIQIGTTLYMYTAWGDNQGTSINLWTSPAADGVTWICRGLMFRKPTGSDWDNGTLFGLFDPNVWQNKHGFFEGSYTAGVNSSQSTGYLVSANGLQWYKYTPAPILANVPTYPGQTYIPCHGLIGSDYFSGDLNVVELNGSLIATYNCDDGTANSNGYGASMTDY